MNGISLTETVWQDVRYGLRLLRRNAGFTTIAVLSLALGIGANTAVFTVVHAVLLRPLPYPDSQRIMRVEQIGSQDVNIPELEFWKAHSRSFEAVSGQRGPTERSLAVGTDREWIKTLTITSDFFRTLGVAPALGREFNVEETRVGGPPAIVLTDSLWRERFNADPNVIGRAVNLAPGVYTVVGVLPHGFWFPQAADAFVPLQPGDELRDNGTNTHMLARLKSGVSFAQAEAETKTVSENFRRANRDVLSKDFRGLALIPYQKWLVGDVRLNLLLLFAAVGLLLLIACSNLASLLLARMASRQKEIAVRQALGSGAGRLLRQFLVENLLLSAAGCAAALLVAQWCLHGMIALVPFDLPASEPIRLNPVALAFAIVVALLATLLFSIAPLATTGRIDLYETLKSGGRTIGGGLMRQRARAFLVVAEVALSVALLASAGLLIRTLYDLQQERLGFEPRGLSTFEITIPADHLKSALDFRNFISTLMTRLSANPGLDNLAGISVLPLTGPDNIPTQRVNHPEQSIGGMEIRVVTPNYFQAMKIPILRGRGFSATDTGAAQPVVLVNQALARAWWPQRGALGDQLIIGMYHGRVFPEIKENPREVVGIVADTKTLFLKEPARPTIYISINQVSDSLTPHSMNWIVRARPTSGLGKELRQIVAGIDPRQRVLHLEALAELVQSTTAGSRFDAWLFGSFAGLALVLTSIGIYGLVSFAVAQRTSEIGTRMALGASRFEILQYILKQGLALTVIGLLLGLAGALSVTRSLSSLLYGVHPTDPMVFIAVSALLLGIGLAASYFPARRATRIDPMVALRYE